MRARLVAGAVWHKLHMMREASAVVASPFPSNRVPLVATLRTASMRLCSPTACTTLVLVPMPVPLPLPPCSASCSTGAGRVGRGGASPPGRRAGTSGNTMPGQ